MYKDLRFCRILPSVLAIALIGSFAGMFLAGSPVQAQISGGTDINLSKLAGDQSECAVAKNPTNKLQIFVLCNNNAGAGLFAARSTDGGGSWTYPDAADKTIADGGNVATQGPAACCDPTLSWDTFGNLFVALRDTNREGSHGRYRRDALGRECGHNRALLGHGSRGRHERELRDRDRGCGGEHHRYGSTCSCVDCLAPECIGWTYSGERRGRDWSGCSWRVQRASGHPRHQ